MYTQIIGSKKWIDYWIHFYTMLAIKHSRLLYPLDEQLMYFALMEAEEWKYKRPWA